MTKEELEKATGQELIEQRNYCGVDGYYNDYLDNVNAEMLKRFNRLAELEKENEELRNNGFTVSAMTDAKEIIRAFITLDYIQLSPSDRIIDLKDKAEQFLNIEVEK